MCFRLPSKEKVSISSDPVMKIPPWFMYLTKGLVKISFKFKMHKVPPFFDSIGKGQKSFPVQLEEGSRLLNPPKVLLNKHFCEEL